MKSSLLSLLLLLLLVLGLRHSALATAPLPPTGRPLAEALNPDGTLKPGSNGSFDARQFRMGTAPDGRPVFRPAGTTGAGDERWQDGFGVPNGTNGTVYTVVWSGTDLYIGGTFTIVENVVANNVAKWNGSGWSALGTGLYNANAIFSLAVAQNGDLYAAGGFSMAGGIAASNVARWNGTAWSSLGTGTANGVNGEAHTVTLAGNGDVYVGGQFNQAGGGAANGVAKWNGSTWSPLGTGSANGVNGAVQDIVVAGNGNIYAGGLFTTAGGITANKVAKWDGNSWSPLGNGMYDGSSGYGSVQTLAVASNGDVYAGGLFTNAGGITTNNVAKWNGTAWSPLGTGTGSGSNEEVYALALAGNGDVYMGGIFLRAGSQAANGVAKWNGTTWSTLGTGTAYNTGYGCVYALALASNGNLGAGGTFTQAGGTGVSFVAKWNSTAWSPLSTGTANGTSGVNGITAVAVSNNGDVYVGGRFSQAGNTAANNVAKWNGSRWSSLGTGTANGVNRDVKALAIASNGDVYVGGTFAQAGGIAVNYVAKWNGTAWSPLGTATASGMNDQVTALAVASNGDVYAGGYFTTAGGIAAPSVAKWNGSGWSAVGTGMTYNGFNAGVKALAIASSGNVYAVGDFTQAGGIAANNVAKWNGSVWSPLSTGTNGMYGVYTVALASNGDVYVGGSFTQAGGIAANGVAKWNGTAWSPLGTGMSNPTTGDVISVLAVASNGDVYAGGYFTQASAMAANGVAKWNGTAWRLLGTGTNSGVTALSIGANGKLYAGGFFTTTGDGSKAMANFGIYDPAAPLATSASAKLAPAALFPNPAHGTATLRLPAGAPRQFLTLTDAQGRLVRRYPAPASTDAELDLRGLPAGVYVVRCGEYAQRLVVE